MGTADPPRRPGPALQLESTWVHPSGKGRVPTPWLIGVWAGGEEPWKPPERRGARSEQRREEERPIEGEEVRGPRAAPPWPEPCSEPRLAWGLQALHCPTARPRAAAAWALPELALLVRGLFEQNQKQVNLTCETPHTFHRVSATHPGARGPVRQGRVGQRGVRWGTWPGPSPPN